MPGLGTDIGVFELVAEIFVVCGLDILAAAAGAALGETKDGEGRRVEGKGDRGRRDGDDALELARERDVKRDFGEKLVCPAGLVVGNDMNKCQFRP